MRIAINAADLDYSRVDGTRIYIWNLLKNFGLLDKKDQFLIYHKNKFNPQLSFTIFENYKILEKPFPFWWTQMRFGWEIFREKPDVLWMPMHSLPYLRSRKTKTVVTIHDLAFKFFPDHFPRKDLRRLNWFTDYAVRQADKLIAVSHSTKKDLLKIYPKLPEEKINVIYHGYDKELFRENISDEKVKKITAKYQISDTKYIIYVGTLQPRKNLNVLIEAFENLRQSKSYQDLKLVIAGDLGWLFEDFIKRVKDNSNIVVTGKFETKDLPALLKGAQVFVLPSLYEGFGLPVLEAMACGTPVVAANNSSLAEIVGRAGILFDAYSSQNLTGVLRRILKDDNLRDELRIRGLERAKDFSWEKCAHETLEWLKS